MEIYKFETSRSLEKHRRHIRADFQSGQRSGAHKTPKFFINGRRYDGTHDAQAIFAATEKNTDSIQ